MDPGSRSQSILDRRLILQSIPVAGLDAGDEVSFSKTPSDILCQVGFCFCVGLGQWARVNAGLAILISLTNRCLTSGTSVQNPSRDSAPLFVSDRNYWPCWMYLGRCLPSWGGVETRLCEGLSGCLVGVGRQSTYCDRIEAVEWLNAGAPFLETELCA